MSSLYKLFEEDLFLIATIRMLHSYEYDIKREN